MASFASYSKLGSIASKLALAYGAPATASGLTSFFSTQFATMRASENEMISRSGRVMEGVIAGYGIGYVAPVALIAAGQLILGAPLQAAGIVASSLVFANPVAATCAAVGAIYYGFGALTSQEQDVLLSTVSRGFCIGIELVKSIVEFCRSSIKALMSAELLSQIKDIVSSYAISFGNNIAAITRSFKDRAYVAAEQAKSGVENVSNEIDNFVTASYKNASLVATSIAEKVQTIRMRGEMGSNPVSVSVDDEHVLKSPPYIKED